MVPWPRDGDAHQRERRGDSGSAKLARLALCRRLGARLAPLEHFSELPQPQALVDRSREWSNTPIELAITELTCLLHPPDPPATQL